MIKLIAGKHPDSSEVYWWQVPDKEYLGLYKSGDYAIVEELGDYGLVKIIGTMEVEEKYVKYLIGKGKKLKNVVERIPRYRVRED